jgi:hypothetical protein
MKIVGKVILYILIYWLLSSFLDNANNYTIEEMVSDANRILENFIPTEVIEKEGFTNPQPTFVYDSWQHRLFRWKGPNLISLAVVLIFYLGVDKKVWKS